MTTTNQLHLFDIDGTITHEGIDLWHAFVTAHIVDHETLAAELEIWREARAKNPFEASRHMMQRSIELLPPGTTSETVALGMRTICETLAREGRIRQAALAAINHCGPNDVVVFATTNFRESAQALIDVLRESSLVTSTALACGTEVDWRTRSLLHFNMGMEKVVGVQRTLAKTALDHPQFQVTACGDDPEGNDVGIFHIAQRGLVIRTTKNAKLRLTTQQQFVDWR